MGRFRSVSAFGDRSYMGTHGELFKVRQWIDAVLEDEIPPPNVT